MRLLFLNPIGNIGGAERVLLTAIAGVKHELPDASIRLLMLADGPLLAAARELGAEVEIVPLPTGLGELGDSQLRGSRAALALRSVARLPGLASFVRRLKTAIARFGPDLVHSNGIKTHLLGRFAIPARIPVVWHLHDFYGLRPAAGWLLRRARSRVRAAVAISNAVAADARAVLPGVRVEVVPNAVDLTRFSPGPGEGEALDYSAGLPVAPPGTVRVGLVATYARWKGHLAVLDAAAKLAKEAPALPVRWFIVGGPIYHTAAQFTEAELRVEAAAHGLTERVGFVPFSRRPRAGLSSTRCCAARVHAAGTIRFDRGRGDGLRPRGDRVVGRRRGGTVHRWNRRTRSLAGKHRSTRAGSATTRRESRTSRKTRPSGAAHGGGPLRLQQLRPTPRFAVSFASPNSVVTVPTRQIDSLTTLRGILALWVVAYHFWNDAVRLFPSLKSLAPLAQSGHFAVPGFFVLSGFVLAFNYSARFATWPPRRVLGFWALRLARIYPVHFVTLLAVAAMIAVSDRLGYQLTDAGYSTRDFILNLFLMHTWVPEFRLNWNYPSWSISSEWFAYLVFPFAAAGLLSRITTWARAAALAVVCLVGAGIAFTVGQCCGMNASGSEQGRHLN